jgi:hypothetical protein
VIVCCWVVVRHGALKSVVHMKNLPESELRGVGGDIKPRNALSSTSIT